MVRDRHNSFPERHITSPTRRARSAHVGGRWPDPLGQLSSTRRRPGHLLILRVERARWLLSSLSPLMHLVAVHTGVVYARDLNHDASGMRLVESTLLLRVSCGPCRHPLAGTLGPLSLSDVCGARGRWGCTRGSSTRRGGWHGRRYWVLTSGGAFCGAARDCARLRTQEGEVGSRLVWSEPPLPLGRADGGKRLWWTLRNARCAARSSF